MKGNDILRLIYSIFLGIAVTSFGSIAVSTAYPQPQYVPDLPETVWADWRLTTGMILLLAATFVLGVSLVWPQDQAVLVNGFLLGGVFTMIYAITMSLSAPQSWQRLAIAALALIVTVVIGWFRFVGRRRPTAAVLEDAEGEAVGGAVEARLAALERKVAAAAGALAP